MNHRSMQSVNQNPHSLLESRLLRVSSIRVLSVCVSPINHHTGPIVDVDHTMKTGGRITDHIEPKEHQVLLHLARNRLQRIGRRIDCACKVCGIDNVLHVLAVEQNRLLAIIQVSYRSATHNRQVLADTKDFVDGCIVINVLLKYEAVVLRSDSWCGVHHGR
jgi:uncharacterized protein YcbK (DUF882 family)